MEVVRLSPPLTLAVACCVASDQLLGFSESHVFHACSRRLDWADSYVFLESLKLGDPAILALCGSKEECEGGEVLQVMVKEPSKGQLGIN